MAAQVHAEGGNFPHLARRLPLVAAAGPPGRKDAVVHPHARVVGVGEAGDGGRSRNLRDAVPAGHRGPKRFRGTSQRGNGGLLEQAGIGVHREVAVPVVEKVETTSGLAARMLVEEMGARKEQKERMQTMRTFLEGAKRS